MTFRILNFYCNGLSYLKHRKLVQTRWRISERAFCDKNEENSSSSESGSSEDQVEMKSVPPQADSFDKKVIAKKKLATLLADFKVDSGFLEKKRNTKLNLAKPSQRLNKKKKVVEEQLTNFEREYPNIEQNLLMAVKNITSNAAEHSEKIESELIDGIESVRAKEDNIITKVDPDVAEEVGANVMCAVKAVASTVVDNQDSEQERDTVKSDLTKKLLAMAFQREAGSQIANRESLTDLFEGMKIEESQESIYMPVKQQTFHSRERKNPFIRQRPTKPMLELQKVDIFDSPPLDIFKTYPTEELKDESSSIELLLWDKLMEKELKSITLFAPADAFEEMIQLTEQGKHWKFPIDNEIDMGAEENVGFHEHVFLDGLLEGFPKKGPIRHFIELVATALSKNPYISVDRKKENIEWFRQYFEEKKSILKQYES